jgi:hypothetical protein
VSRWIPLSGALATALLLGVAALAAARGAPPSDVVLAIAAAFVPYGALALAPLPPRLAIGVAAAAGVALVLAPSVLSDDVFRYVWDGRVLGRGIDPYAYPPDHPALAPLRDGLHAHINNPELPTIYPPVAQLVFLAAGAVAHAPWTAKLAALVAHLCTSPLVGRLAGPERAARAVALHALNPLALEEAALGGHVDAFAALFLVLAVLALASGRDLRASLALAAAAGVKLVGLALVPLLAAPGRARRLAPVGLAAALGGAMLLPLAAAGHGSHASSGLANYAYRWRGNDGGFALLAAAAEGALDLVGRARGSEPGTIDLPAGWIEAAGGTPLDPYALRDPKKAIARPGSLSTSEVADRLARALAALIVLAIAIVHARRATPPLRASRDVVLALLLLSPQVHPWYLAWLLPLEIACGGSAGLVWSAAILVAYAPLDAWGAHRIWNEAPLARAIEYAIVALALVVDRVPERMPTPPDARDPSRDAVRASAAA